jgi:hypothetical protein
VILYAGLVVAAPYLMWRLVASLNTRPHPTTTHQGDTLWQQGEGEHFIAKERVMFCLIGPEQKFVFKGGFFEFFRYLGGKR